MESKAIKYQPNRTAWFVPLFGALICFCYALLNLPGINSRVIFSVICGLALIGLSVCIFMISKNTICFEQDGVRFEYRKDNEKILWEKYRYAYYVTIYTTKGPFRRLLLSAQELTEQQAELCGRHGFKTAIGNDPVYTIPINDNKWTSEMDTLVKSKVQTVTTYPAD